MDDLSYDVIIFNEIIDEKIKQDKENGILSDESLKVAEWMKEQAKKKSTRDLAMMNIQLPKIFNNNQDKPLKDCLELKIHL